jgi:hypothetical protein
MDDNTEPTGIPVEWRGLEMSLAHAYLGGPDRQVCAGHTLRGITDETGQHRAYTKSDARALARWRRGRAPVCPTCYGVLWLVFGWGALESVVWHRTRVLELGWSREDVIAYVDEQRAQERPPHHAKRVI